MSSRIPCLPIPNCFKASLIRYFPQENPGIEHACPRKGNFPRPLSAFVGRQSEIDQPRHLLSESHLVTLAGPRGNGKTRLSLRIANELGTASQNLDFLRELKVDQAIDSSSTRFEDVVEPVDIVLDTIGGDTLERSWGVLKPGGILVSTVQQPSEQAAAAHNVRGAMVFSTPPIGETLNVIAELVDAGEIKPQISSIFPLREIRKAHKMIEGKHTRGKIVLQVAA